MRELQAALARATTMGNPSLSTDLVIGEQFAKAQQEKTPQLPSHVQLFINLMQSHFAYAKDGREWDVHDTRGYGKQVWNLSGPQVREVFDTLRERFKWRPEVCDVREVVQEILGNNNAVALPGYAIAASRNASDIISEMRRYRDGGNGDTKQIAGTGESPARREARDNIRSLKGWVDSGRRAATEKFNRGNTSKVDDAVLLATPAPKGTSQPVSVVSVLDCAGLTPEQVAKLRQIAAEKQAAGASVMLVNADDTTLAEVAG